MATTEFASNHQSVMRPEELAASEADATPADPSLDQKMAVEFLGTFVLVFTVGMSTSKSGAGILAPLAIGSALMVMVFAGAHISGAHYNPAVSISMLVRGKAAPRQTLAYIPTQLVAGALAGLLVRALAGTAAPAALAKSWKIFVLEFLFTAALAYVVLNVATAKATEGNSFYGLAIGFTLATGVFAAGKLSGGAFNPAVALGGTVTGSLRWSHYWIYVVASCLGGLAAALVFRYLQLNRTERRTVKREVVRRAGPRVPNPDTTTNHSPRPTRGHPASWEASPRTHSAGKHALGGGHCPRRAGSAG